MSENKTRKTDASVMDFIVTIANPQRRSDSEVLLELFQSETGEAPRMWGDSIVGFGNYHYRYDSGREGDWFLTGFSPRKQNLSLYIMPGADRFQAELNKLGKHKLGKSCLYINQLRDVNLDVLRTLISKAVHYMREKHG